MTSFLDTLSAPFTGQPAIDAAGAARQQLLDTFLAEASRGRQLVFGAEDWPGYQQLNNLASQQGRDIAGGYLGAARTDVTGGALGGIGALNRDYLAPLQMTQQQLADVTGANGQAGYDRAMQQFHTSPGYNFRLTQGLDAIARNANAAGMLASGNQMQESQRFGEGLAAEDYNNWLKTITQRENLYAPITSREFDLYSQLGQNLGSLDVNTGAFYNQSLIDQANRNASLGMGQYGQEIGLAGIFGPALASTNLAVGAAQQQAGANTVNLAGNIFSGLGNFFRGSGTSLFR